MDGKVDVVIGARSAIFAPFPRLGMIVIDEEHEGSYKSGTTPRYHARQVAMYRAAQEKRRAAHGKRDAFPGGVAPHEGGHAHRAAPARPAQRRAPCRPSRSSTCASSRARSRAR